MSALSFAWTGYLEVLARCARTRAAVRPSVRRTHELETALDITLPAELKEWFDLHDGTGHDRDGELLPLNFLIGIDQVLDTTAMTRQIWSEAEDLQEYAATRPHRAVAGTVVGAWMPDYVYISQDGLGGGLFVDTRAGVLQGCVRNWDKVEADEDHERGPLARSLSDFVALASEAVRTTAPMPRLGFRPSTVDGALRWEPPMA